MALKLSGNAFEKLRLEKNIVIIKLKKKKKL